MFIFKYLSFQLIDPFFLLEIFRNNYDYLVNNYQKVTDDELKEFIFIIAITSTSDPKMIQFIINNSAMTFGKYTKWDDYLILCFGININVEIIKYLLIGQLIGIELK